MIEGRVNYLIVGIFVILGILLFGIVLYTFSHIGESSKYTEYLIVTSQSVQGLKPSASVYYKGVQIGKVKSMEIDPENQKLIRIKVLIDKKLNIDKGISATLGVQGITGIAYLLLTEDPEAKITFDKKEKLKVIPMKESNLQRLVSALPETIYNTNKLLENINQILNKLEFERINRVLAKLEKNSDELSQVLKESQLTVKEASYLINQAKEKLYQIDIEEFNNVTRDSRKLIAQYTIVAEELEKEIKKLDELFSKSSKILNTADAELLPQILKTVKEIERTSQNLSELSKSLKEKLTLFPDATVKKSHLEE
ncbi:MAG: MCE family protein [Thermodesulfobacterium sp.]|nr:MCE family protein [Thermodesulfobacterium sp.]